MPSLKVYAHDGEDIVIEKKMAPAASKTEEKGELSMGPMVSSGWKSKDYSVPIEEFVSLVGKVYRNAGGDLRGFRTPDYWGWPDEVGSPTSDTQAKGNQGREFGSPRWRDT